MAMDGDVLGLAIKAALDGAADLTDRDALFKAMGQAIVTHIKNNAVVTTTAVQPGGGTAPGTIA